MPKPKKRGSNHQRGSGGRGGGARSGRGGSERATFPVAARVAGERGRGRPGPLAGSALAPCGAGGKAAGRTGAAAELPAGRDGPGAGPGPGAGYGPGGAAAAAGLTGAGPETATSRRLRACARRRGRRPCLAPPAASGAPRAAAGPGPARASWPPRWRVPLGWPEGSAGSWAAAGEAGPARCRGPGAASGARPRHAQPPAAAPPPAWALPGRGRGAAAAVTPVSVAVCQRIVLPRAAVSSKKPSLACKRILENKQPACKSGMWWRRCWCPLECRFCGVVRNLTSGYRSCEQSVSLVSNVQEVTGSLGPSAAAFILVCEGLAVILATSPIELPCLTFLEARRWLCQSAELPSFLVSVLANGCPL